VADAHADLPATDPTGAPDRERTQGEGTGDARRPASGDPGEELSGVDEEILESFPASDPPSDWAGPDEGPAAGPGATDPG
jgi:hypothetical protein